MIEDEKNVIRVNKEVDIDEYRVLNRFKKISSEDKDRIEKLGIDIVHTFGTGNIAFLGKKIATKMNVPYISTILRDELEARKKERINNNKKESKIINKMLENKINSLFKNASYVTSFYPSTGKEFTDTVIKYGFNIRKFNKSTDEEVEAKIKKLKVNNKNVYLMISSFRKEYDNTSVIYKFKDILNIDKKAVLLIIGNGECKDKVIKAIADNELTDRVILLDSITDSLDLYYRLAHAYIYHNDIAESYLFTVMAMLEGLPVIASYSTGINDLIKDYQNGLFYHSIDEMEDMVKTLLKDEETKNKLANYKNVAEKEFDSLLYAKNMEKLYLKAIRNKNSQRKDDIYRNRKHRRREINKK